MKKLFSVILLCAAVCLSAGCAGKSSPNVPDEDLSDGETVTFTRGKWNGDVYISDLFGLKITLDPDCTKETNETLASMNGFSDMSDASLVNAVEKSNGGETFYEMVVNYHKRGSIELTYSRIEDVSLDTVVRDNVSELKSSSMFKDVHSEMLNVSGKEHPCIYATFVSGTTEVDEAIVLYKKGDYFAVVTISALFDGELQSVIKNVLG